MKLSYASINNYRSITTAHKIEPSNLTVFVGKNNEGKSNTIKAIVLGMRIINSVGINGRRLMSARRLYDWERDFPVNLQKSNKMKNKVTRIRFDFSLNEEEVNELYDKIGSLINGELSIYITIGEGSRLSITVPKKGKNAKAFSSKIGPICEFICNRFEIQYIPAIRSGENAVSIMQKLLDFELRNIDDQVYTDSIEYISKKQIEVVADLSKKITKDLEAFLPEIRKVRLDYDQSRPLDYLRGSLNVVIDDGTPTDLSYKGDGVKSLITMALLSSTSKNKDRLVIIDEPENNLHPGAIRYINSVLYNLSETCQVIISTHDPIFVNRFNVSSNWIVDNHEATQAKRLDKIRNTLGIMCSDNLMYSDYVIVVEGPTDRDFLLNVFKKYDKINEALQSNIISIRVLGGVNNLDAEVYSLQRYCCNYLILLDRDKAGKDGANRIKSKFSVSDNDIRFFMKENKKYECELEDLINIDIYKEYLLEKGFDVTDRKFKNISKKWSERLDIMSSDTGIEFSAELENELKKGLQALIKDSEDFLTDHGKVLINSICKKIEKDLEKMYRTS